MLKKIILILLSTTLLFTGCSNNNINQNNNKESIKLTYSNLIDDKTQNDIKNILIENKIDKKTSNYFIKLVRDYNEKSEIKNLYTSNNGFTSISVQQVPYDEVELGEKWDYNNINYIDFNCRLTAFTLFKDYIKSNSKFSGDDTTLMFDIEAIENNPLSEFTKEDKDKFINLYGAIKTENTQDIQKHVDKIKKEWKNRKISFIDNKNVSMINVFLHAPEWDEILFVGHSGISVKTKDDLLFIEKYGPSLPYQVSKFKDKSELKKYLMDRLDVDTSNNGAAKPIIMENNELMN